MSHQDVQDARVEADGPSGKTETTARCTLRGLLERLTDSCAMPPGPDPHPRALVQARVPVEQQDGHHSQRDLVRWLNHEIRTPLNAILGFAQLLEAEASPGDDLVCRQRLRHIRSAGEHIASLLDGFVSEVGVGPVECENAVEVDLQSFLEETVPMVEQAAAEFGVSLARAYLASNPIAAACVPTHLRQVLLNVLMNAIKYNRSGGSVRISLMATADRACVVVQDTGVGMTSGQLEHLFEPHNRLGRETGSVPGSGIGLALSRDLMVQMGGRIAVASAAGRGSTVNLQLPLARVRPESMSDN